MSTAPRPTASPGGAPAGMPARLWELAKHGARGTIPQWVRGAPDAGATAPPRISQIARRATQAVAAAGVVAGGIAIGIGATEVAARPVDLAHPGGPSGADHTNTDHGSGSPVGSHSVDVPGPPGNASESGVTLHTTSDGGHLDTGLATTWRIPGHGAAGGEHGQTDTGGGEHGEAGAVVGHDGLTVEMYQDVAVQQGADGMYSVDAVEYVVVRDEHGHTYVFRDNYHTVVPDPPGQETDLVVNETEHVQVMEHPDGSFSVTQADNSISVTVGSGSDGQHEVTVTQSESVQIGHDPDADGHDTTSLTENEYGGTTSDQTEVVTEQTGPPEPGTDQASASMPQPPITGSTISSTASTAASSQAGTAQPTPPEGLSAARTMATPPPLATSLGTAATTVGGLTSGHEPNPPGAFAGLSGGSAEPGHGTAPTGHFPNEPVPTQPTGVVVADHDQPALDEPSAHADIDLAAVHPTEPYASPDGDSVGEHEEASGAHFDSSAGLADEPSGHDPGTDTTVIH
jgi:hypothetical protein